MFERSTQYNRVGGTLNDADWIADLESFSYLEGGAQINAADFPTAIRSGVIVHVEAGVVKPGKGTGVFPTGLTRYDYDPLRRGVGSSNTMAVVVGGVIHVDKLPVMPKVGDLPATFVLQNDSGKAFTP